MSEATVIRPEYEAELRQMVRALEDATGLHSRWVACSTLQATADTAIGELLSTVDAVRAERDTATARAEAAEQRAEAAEAAVARMFASARATADRYTRDAENARKHRLVWEESARMEAEVAKLILRAMEQAAQPAGEVSR